MKVGLLTIGQNGAKSAAEERIKLLTFLKQYFDTLIINYLKSYILLFKQYS